MKPQYATLIVEIGEEPVNDSGIPCIPATTKVRVTPHRVRMIRPGCRDLCYGKRPAEQVNVRFTYLHELPEPESDETKRIRRAYKDLLGTTRMPLPST